MNNKVHKNQDEQNKKNDENKEKLYRWMVLIVVIIGTFMAILDSSIVNIALAKIMAVFGVSVDDVQWVITAYTLVMGAVIPLTGYLADRFGGKKTYIFALSVFTIGSLLCGFAWNNNVMIVSRIIQGIGGGMIMPVGLSILFKTFPIEERGMAMGFWGIAAMAAPTIGPTIGGYIIENISWRLIFTINIPLGVLGVILTWIILRPDTDKRKDPFDYIGLITSAIGMIFILYVLGQDGGDIDWGDIKNVLMLTIGAFSLIIFYLNEKYHKYPLLDFSVFKSLEFTASIIITILTQIALFGAMFIMPIFLQNIRGYTPIQTGLILLPSAMAMGLVMPISGKISDKTGARPFVIAGGVLIAIGSYFLTKLTFDTSIVMINIWLIVRAIGLGLSMMPAGTAGLNSISKHLTSRATAMNNTIKQISNSISITILVNILNRYNNYSFSKYSEQITPLNSQLNLMAHNIGKSLVANGTDTATATGGIKLYIYAMISKLAYISGINATFFASLLMGLICIPFAFLFMKPKRSQPNVEIESNEEKIIINKKPAELSFETD